MTVVPSELSSQWTQATCSPLLRVQIATCWWYSNYSKEYERETGTADESINSDVSVAPTAVIAVRELQAIREGNTQACLSRYVTLLFRLLANSEGHGMTASPVRITSFSLPAPGTAGSFGWRMSGMVGLHGIKVPFDIDIAGFVIGQAEVTLFAAGLPEPVPAATEQRLFVLLVGRAETQLRHMHAPLPRSRSTPARRIAS